MMTYQSLLLLSLVFTQGILAKEIETDRDTVLQKRYLDSLNQSEERTEQAPASALYNKLLSGYNFLARPVKSAHDTVSVKFGLTLLQIISLNEQQDTLTSLVWERLEWDDPFLAWNPVEYGNITSVRIPPHRIWKPDILIYNSASDVFDPKYQTDVVLRSNGSIIYIPPGMHSTTCKLSYKNFPFDEQKCELKFGSWTQDGGELDIQLHSTDGVDISSFMSNSQWKLHGAPITRNAIFYACCPDPYIDITAVIHLQRRGDWILSKARDSNSLICFTLFLSFLIPVSSGHKISFAIAHLAFVWYTVWALTSEFPHLIENSVDGGGPLVGYFEIMLFLSKLALGANIFTVWLYHCPIPMPTWVRKNILQTIQKIDPILLKVNDHCSTSVSDGVELVERRTETDSSHFKIQDEWSYLSLTTDRCFLVFFTLLGLLIWLICFPSFN